MNKSVSERIADVPLRSLKADLRESETDSAEVQKAKFDAGHVLDTAKNDADLEVKEIFDVLGISESLTHRAFKSGEIAFWRLWLLDDAFWAELLVAVAKKRRVARVRVSIDLPDRRSA